MGAGRGRPGPHRHHRLRPGRARRRRVRPGAGGGRRGDGGRTLQRGRVDQVVTDIYAPISGTIVEVNADLADEPQRINDDPYGDGWICVIRPADRADLDGLLDATAYQALVDG